MNTFGERLKEARKSKGLTQRQLAALINAKHNSISNWENDQNKPDPDTIEIICGVLDIEPNYLLLKETNNSNESIVNTTSTTYIDNHIRSLIHKYSELDNKGKHTVDTVLEMEYNRCNKPHLIAFAAHAREGANEEDIQNDLDMMDDENF
ncbi:MAG: helix-turn-helix domain-containing protein [Anaerocolumna sp.]